MLVWIRDQISDEIAAVCLALAILQEAKPGLARAWAAFEIRALLQPLYEREANNDQRN